MNSKVCSICKKEKPLEMFNKNKNAKDGLDSRCKECMHEIYLSQRECRLKYQKYYKKSDEQRFKEQQERYKSKNKDKIAEQIKKSNEKRYEYRQEYYKKNKDKILEYNRNYLKQRRKNDDLYYFKCRIREVIYGSFKRKKLNKQYHTTEILGCDFDFFVAHLYKTFFNNYGYEYDENESVHIDHIIPLATAKNEEDVLKLCHYTNLQLLKAKDNLIKSSKM